jgi:hypothetical protein
MSIPKFTTTNLIRKALLSLDSSALSVSLVCVRCANSLRKLFPISPPTPQLRNLRSTVQSIPSHNNRMLPIDSGGELAQEN